ncbi:Embryo defective protein [Quillaja saponaria]|uniref:Embryo defective protein n=1 Tax=Quillaja saponaria TaxID=32244 RepID=A0AAD7QI40_QUISA|nr:Embryo defective protein [Quillaja saponaria]KAJ7981756.1 Embryo defective protein [Quillaja saponaria]
MSRGPDRLVRSLKKFADSQYKFFSTRYGQQFTDILEFPIKLVLSPFTLAFDIAGSASRGFGVPEFISKLSYASIFVVATLGTYDIALELGKKVICQRNCRTCNGWQALRCTMCRGSGRVHYQVKSYALKSGEKATAESVADAIAENRAELVHIPSSLDLHSPLPSKDCPTCDGTGVMGCPECKHKLQVRISADDIMEPPWTAYNILRKMDYPYEHIVHSMKDPSIAAFWLITLPQVVGGFNYDDDVKQKIWWQYKDSMRYDQLRDVVAKRKPGWEYLQEALISIDPARARDDPVIVKNVPYYKAKKALEAEVMKLNPPPRPPNWGELDLPLNASSWTEEDLKDSEKFYEMTVLLNAQREIADKILDAQWEAKWHQEKLNEMLKEKVQPYIKNLDRELLSPPIIIQSKNEDQKRTRQKRWWFF